MPVHPPRKRHDPILIRTRRTSSIYYCLCTLHTCLEGIMLPVLFRYDPVSEYGIRKKSVALILPDSIFIIPVVFEDERTKAELVGINRIPPSRKASLLRLNIRHLPFTRPQENNCTSSGTRLVLPLNTHHLNLSAHRLVRHPPHTSFTRMEPSTLQPKQKIPSTPLNFQNAKLF